MFENINTLEFVTILFMCTTLLFFLKYQYTKSSMEGYYRYVKPDASKQEIKSFLDKLSKLDDYNNIVKVYNKLLKEHKEMIDDFCDSTIELVSKFEEIFNIFHDLNSDMWNTCYVKHKNVRDVFDKHKDNLSKAYDGFDEIIDDLNMLVDVWKEQKDVK